MALDGRCSEIILGNKAILKCFFHPFFLIGLLYAGDKLVEVNGVPVEGLEPEQVINILVFNLF